MRKTDITDKIERLEAMEDRLGVTIESLSAFIEDDDDDHIYLTVCGELLAVNGTEIKKDIELVIAAYDTDGRIIATCDHYMSSDEFFGLETFDVTTSLPIRNISKIRIYPKKAM